MSLTSICGPRKSKKVVDIEVLLQKGEWDAHHDGHLLDHPIGVGVGAVGKALGQIVCPPRVALTRNGEQAGWVKRRWSRWSSCALKRALNRGHLRGRALLAGAGWCWSISRLFSQQVVDESWVISCCESGSVDRIFESSLHLLSNNLSHVFGVRSFVHGFAVLPGTNHSDPVKVDSTVSQLS